MKLSKPTLSFIGGFTTPVFWVKNVGQGNLNILETEEFNVFYDLGYSLNAPKNEVDLFYSKNIKFFQKRFVVIISHWDLDHYQLLLKLAESQELKNLTKLIVSSVMPNRTVENLVANLESKNVSIIKVPCSPKERVARGLNVYTEFDIFQPFMENNLANLTLPPYVEFKIFRGGRRADRNRYSIVVIMVFEKYKIVLTGDSNYRDVDNFVFTKLEFNEDDILCYVVPHHGGKAGIVTFENVLFDKAKSDFIISVGLNNSYGHPLDKNIEELKNYTQNLYQTDVLQGDYKKELFVNRLRYLRRLL